ncbi:SgcJ/EcaC family oxidoreductase [Streptomyces sp. NBC_01304]|uniref:SgcJ/EcaC family oxidoreductase n=1 Tax=Streptomyces sp. NBC_01304 TaxID=2903818 RepID=UPI002E0D71DB|nr:SgcJ/EcaC family oxidoreductase [Streptomyces sp. NBC_01304]
MTRRHRGRAVAFVATAALLATGAGVTALAAAPDRAAAIPDRTVAVPDQARAADRTRATDRTRAAAVERPAGKPSEARIRALFKQWAAALDTGDPERVADRYAADGVLIPTLSNEVRTDRAGIVDYFEHFLRKDPEATITKSVVDVLDARHAVDAGTYRFTLTDPKTGAVETVDARYTFVYKRVKGAWVIENHHSSAMPEKASGMRESGTPEKVSPAARTPLAPKN